MNAVLGVLELEHILDCKTPPLFRENTQVLATDALLVSRGPDGQPVVVPTDAHGSGQMPHRLCLGAFDRGEWSQRAKEQDADTRLPAHGRKWLTLGAALVRSAATATRSCMFSFDQKRGARAAFHDLLRSLFRQVVCMFCYYMNVNHAHAAVGTDHARGLHANVWFRQALRRFLGSAFEFPGVAVGYADALCYTGSDWDTRDLDQFLYHCLRRELATTDSDVDLRIPAYARGWVVSKSELTKESSRARWLFIEMLGVRSIMLNDGDGSAWQLQQLHHTVDASLSARSFLSPASPNPRSGGLRPPEPGAPAQHEEVHYCLRHRPALPAPPPQLVTEDIWTVIMGLAGFGPSAALAVIRPLQLPSPPELLAQPSVSTLALYLIITRSSSWHGTRGRLRAVAFMHGISRAHNQPRKIIVAVHKTVPGGIGKALWGNTLERSRIANILVRSVGLLEPRLQAYWGTHPAAQGEHSFTTDDVEPLLPHLSDDEQQMRPGGIPLNAPGLMVLRPSALWSSAHTPRPDQRFDCAACTGDTYICSVCDVSYCADCSPGPCTPDSVRM